MTINFASQDSNVQRMSVGTSNISVSFTNASAVIGKTIQLNVCNPGTGLIGSTTFSGVLWDGGVSPGNSVVNGQCDRFSFTSTLASSTDTTAVIYGNLIGTF
jgi:hypothetical protein